MQAAEQLAKTLSPERVAERRPKPELIARAEQLSREAAAIRSADTQVRQKTLTRIYTQLGHSPDEALTLAQRDTLGGEAELIKSRKVVTFPEAGIRETQAQLRVAASAQEGVLRTGEASEDSSHWQGSQLEQSVESSTTFQGAADQPAESREEPMTIGMKAPLPALELEPLAPAAQNTSIAERRRNVLKRLQELNAEAEEARGTAAEVDSAFDALTTPPSAELKQQAAEAIPDAAEVDDAFDKVIGAPPQTH